MLDCRTLIPSPDAQLSIVLDGDGRIFGMITDDDWTALARAPLNELDAELRDHASTSLELRLVVSSSGAGRSGIA